MTLVIERDIELYLKRQVEGLGGKCIKFSTLSESGIPDRIVILPKGKVAFVELKRPKGGKLAPLQKYQIAKLSNLGVVARVVKTKDEVDNLLNNMTGGDSNEISAT